MKLTNHDVFKDTRIDLDGVYHPDISGYISLKIYELCVKINNVYRIFRWILFIALLAPITIPKYICTAKDKPGCCQCIKGFFNLNFIIDEFVKKSWGKDSMFLLVLILLPYIMPSVTLTILFSLVIGRSQPHPYSGEIFFLSWEFFFFVSRAADRLDIVDKSRELQLFIAPFGLALQYVTKSKDPGESRTQKLNKRVFKAVTRILACIPAGMVSVIYRAFTLRQYMISCNHYDAIVKDLYCRPEKDMYLCCMPVRSIQISNWHIVLGNIISMCVTFWGIFGAMAIFVVRNHPQTGLSIVLHRKH